MAKKRFCPLFFLLFVFCGLRLSSGASETNGTVGAPLVWQCKLNEPFAPEKISIYWQDQNDIESLHYYKNGKENLDHQSLSFKNRTRIFPKELPSGNLSLLIDPLMLKDDQKSLKVVVITDSIRSICQSIIHVAASFKEPIIEISQTEMTATCTTKGGFPKPALSWSSVNHEGHERTLEPPDVQTSEIQEGDGTYTIISTAGIPGSKKVTCSIYNPTSNQTVRAAEDVPADEALPLYAKVVIAVLIVLVVLAVGIGYQRCTKSHRESPGPQFQF
ncbi:ICOS ligand-like isoform X2 [Archocentrus centrarchus]|uniref:ICOS ligand-like isoform X2 n=1 Tax=Archocentrus centrarchus TaxID=63155 RepID=UPI0011E9CAE9|nr:ICOS ligand-like isoform X2 [Archocentrus centrarchus]